MSCSRTQHGGGRSRTPDLSLRSPTLYHWATALPYIQKESNQSLHCLLFHLHFGCITVMILSFRTDMPGQTVQTQIRLIRVYTVCHSVRIVWTHYSMVEPHRSNFRVIATNILGVQIFRKFTVMVKPPRSNFRIIKAIFSGVCTFQVITVGSKSHFSPPDLQY